VLVRVLGEGQYEVPEAAARRIEELDEQLERAVLSGDEEWYREVVKLLNELVKEGKPVSGEFRPSELVVPSAEMGLDEVRRYLEQGASEG
jgi:hypothetical protein